jgi:hypothetical protein
MHNKNSLNRIALLAGAILLTSIPAAANAITFDGYHFASLYGPENLTLDGGGNLVVPTTASDYGGAATALPGGTVIVAASFLDSGLATGPSAELWVQDLSATPSYEAALGAFTGDADYFVLYRVNGVNSSFLDTGVLRTAGTHSAEIEQLGNGTVDFFLDNSLVGAATAAQFGIPVFKDVVLTANGSAAGQQATFTMFTSATPEPSSALYLFCGAAILAGLLFRKSA